MNPDKTRSDPCSSVFIRGSFVCYNNGIMQDNLFPSDAGYKRIKRIGSGGFAEVFHAEAPGGIEVAIKSIFQPIDKEGAVRERQSLELIKRLRHPYLVQIHSFHIINDHLHVVMELADCSLREIQAEFLASGAQGIPRQRLVPWLVEAAEAPVTFIRLD